MMLDMHMMEPYGLVYTSYTTYHGMFKHILLVKLHTIHIHGMCVASGKHGMIWYHVAYW